MRNIITTMASFIAISFSTGVRAAQLSEAFHQC
jgi:hypothetical protein